jgi:hypothetical protein
VQRGHERFVAAAFQAHPVVHAGVVHQSVDAPEGIQRGPYGRRAGFGPGEFGHYLEGPAAGFFHFGHGLPVVFFIAPHDDGNGAFRGQHPYDSLADALGTAGHYDHFITQL